MGRPSGTDVVDDLASEEPSHSMDDAEDSIQEEGFEEGDALSDEMGDATEDGLDGGEALDDAYAQQQRKEAIEEGIEGFAEADPARMQDALEEAMADALDANDAGEYFRLLAAGIRRVAAMGVRARGVEAGAANPVRRAAHAGESPDNWAARITGEAERSRERRTGSRDAMTNLPHRILPVLRRYAADGFDELEAFQDLADRFAEGGLDKALPVLAGMAARTLAFPGLQRGAVELASALRRELVRGSRHAAHTLVRRRGPQAVRALPRIARSVARTAERQRLPPAALPRALRRVAERVTTKPQLMQHLVSPTAITTSPPTRLRVVSPGMPRRFSFRGPVEITIRSR
jgi:hypothetical protein